MEWRPALPLGLGFFHSPRAFEACARRCASRRSAPFRWRVAFHREDAAPRPPTGPPGAPLAGADVPATRPLPPAAHGATETEASGRLAPTGLPPLPRAASLHRRCASTGGARAARTPELCLAFWTLSLVPVSESSNGFSNFYIASRLWGKAVLKRGTLLTQTAAGWGALSAPT